MTERYDVVVLGAGIVGVSTALHLLMRGKKVLLIDRHIPAKEASFGNAGIIGNGYVLPFGSPSLASIPSILLGLDTSVRIRMPDLLRCLPWIIDFFLKSRTRPRRKNGRALFALSQNSTEEHRFLMQGTEALRHLIMTGRVNLYRSEKSFNGSLLERTLAHELGVPFDVMDANSFGECEPDLKPVYHRAVRWRSSPRLNNPGAVVTAYHERFVREGGNLLQSDAHKLFQDGNGWWAETWQGRHNASSLVIATGPWASGLLKPLGYHVPIGFKRGYHQHFAALGTKKLVHALGDVDFGYVVAPMEAGYRLTTGAELASLEAPPNPVQLSRILPHARELFPLGETVQPTPWYASRACFTDSLPVIGPASHHKDLWFNFGHGHFGMTLGPASGRLLADMMEGKPSFCDPAPYRAGRFGC